MAMSGGRDDGAPMMDLNMTPMIDVLLVLLVIFALLPAWGLAGFAAFTLAPNLGLPPELPAMPAADLLARQAWWIGTVVATAAGLALIVFGRSPWFAVLGIALLLRGVN